MCRTLGCHLLERYLHCVGGALDWVWKFCFHFVCIVSVPFLNFFRDKKKSLVHHYSSMLGGFSLHIIRHRRYVSPALPFICNLSAHVQVVRAFSVCSSFLGLSLQIIYSCAWALMRLGDRKFISSAYYLFVGA